MVQSKAIASAAGIACAELNKSRSVIVEALVEDESRKIVAKIAVAVCVGDLQIDDRQEAS